MTGGGGVKARVGNGSTTHNILSHLYSKRRPAAPGVETTERSGSASPRWQLCPFKRFFLLVIEHFFHFPAFPAAEGEAEGSYSTLATLKIFLAISLASSGNSRV